MSLLPAAHMGTSQKKHPNRATLYKGTTVCPPCNFKLEREDNQRLSTLLQPKAVR